MSTTTATAAGLPPPLLPDIFFAVAALKSFKHTITLMFFFRRDGTQELSQAYDNFDVFFRCGSTQELSQAYNHLGVFFRRGSTQELSQAFDHFDVFLIRRGSTQELSQAYDKFDVLFLP